MVHRSHAAAISEGHAQDLRRGRSRTIEAHVVGSRADHLDRLADCLRGKCRRHGVVAVEAAAESSSERVGAQHDLLLAAAQRLGQYWQYERLPLIPGMDFKNAVFFES